MASFSDFPAAQWRQIYVPSNFHLTTIGAEEPNSRHEIANPFSNRLVAHKQDSQRPIRINGLHLLAPACNVRSPSGTTAIFLLGIPLSVSTVRLTKVDPHRMTSASSASCCCRSE